MKPISRLDSKNSFDSYLIKDSLISKAKSQLNPSSVAYIQEKSSL